MNVSRQLVAPLSRRRFAGLLGAGFAAAALPPSSPAAAEPTVGPDLGTVIRLSSNENPYGPSPAVYDALRAAFGRAWRYPDEAEQALVEDLARLHGVAPDHVLLGNGSGEILQLAAAAFTGPGRPAVLADPAFEAVARYARTKGAEVVRVPLTADHRHDLEKMLTVTRFTGLLYVCNPNNPTGTVTSGLGDAPPRLPSGAVLLVDEAYHHYAAEGAAGDGYTSALPLLARHPNLLVTRTFSKIFGLAGLRLGYAVARPETIDRLRYHQTLDAVNGQAIAAARAALQDTGHLESCRRRNQEIRTWVAAELAARGFTSLPSQANFLMTDLRRDVQPVIDALRTRGVEVGRRFPALPTYLRVTVGTRPQMESFLRALAAVLAT
ncbi:MAG TPA: aminotransferase [Acidobacteria bacterium]|nr:aminotransferase [Acidobacteriota bacterium]